MAEKVYVVGTVPKTITYSDASLQRGGFLNIHSFCYAEDGGPKHCRDLMERGNAAVILPVDLEKRELYMIEQGRHLRIFAEDERGEAAIAKRDDVPSNAFDAPFDTVKTLECPAGIIDPGETPEQAAVRELKEETGIKVTEDTLVKVASYYPSVGGCTERITAFIAKLNGPVTHEGGHADDLERIIVWKMSFDEAFDALRNGRIVTASSHIVLRELMLLDQHRS